jgi:hypothetical protein
LSESIEQKLKAGLLAPPADFTARVMAAVDRRPLPAAARPPSRLRELLEWFALGGAVVTGLAQLIPLLFGLWIVSTAS